MAKAEDLTGKRFNYLTVLERDYEAQAAHPKERIAWWKCRCEACGQIKSFRSFVVKRSITCGCRKNPDRKPREVKIKPKNKENFSGIDLSGQRFGHLVVLKWLGTFNKNSRYLVRCDCGKEYVVYAQNLTQGGTTSCGCTKESHGEMKIKEILINNNISFTTQKSFPNFKYSDTYGTPRYDFFLPEKKYFN